MRKSYNPEQSVTDVLQFFPSVQRDMLCLYLKKNLKVKDPEKVIDRLSHIGRIVEDKNGFFALNSSIEPSVLTTCEFAVFQRMSKTEELRLSKARYPYDYVFDAGHKIYLLLAFAREGIYKLSFEKNSDKPKTDPAAMPTPVIMLINDTVSSLDTGILPDHCLVAMVSYADYKVKGINIVEYNKKGDEQ